MTRARAIGAVVILCAVWAALGFTIAPHCNGTAEAGERHRQRLPSLFEARELADYAEAVLEAERLNCVGGIRTVSVVNDHTLRVICGYSNAYTIDMRDDTARQDDYP